MLAFLLEGIYVDSMLGNEALLAVTREEVDKEDSKEVLQNDPV